MPSWRKWLRAAHVQFFTAVIVPGLLGAAVAYHRTGLFSGHLLLLTIVGLCLAHAGTNMNNDYYDYVSGNDVINAHPSPFNGGTRVLVEGLLQPQQVQRASWLCYGAAAGIGLLLACLRGLAVLIFVAVGLLCSFFYSADPIRLSHRTLGEVLVGLNFGPMIVLGSYFVQTQQVDWAPVLAALPVGLLISAVLLINEIPDVDADRAVGKSTVAVKWGPERTLPGYFVLLASAYVVVAAQVLLGMMPPTAWLALITLPGAAIAANIAYHHYHHPSRLLPASAFTIAVHLLTGLLLGTSFLIA